MKKYLVAMVVLVSVSANAGTNPFDLKENLQRIDKDQDVLLSALKKIADEQEAADDLDDENTNEERQGEVQPSIQQNTDLEGNIESTVNVEQNNTNSKKETDDIKVSTEDDSVRVDAIREKLMAEEARKHKAILEKSQKKDEASKEIKAQQLAMQKQEEERIQKVQEEQAKVERERAKEAEAKANKEAAEMAAKAAEEKRLAIQKREEEKREVEAYEAKRLAKKKAEEALAAEKKMAEKKQALEAAKAQALEKEKAKEEKKHAVVDINLTREALVAKKEADKAYLEAVKEMDSEN